MSTMDEPTPYDLIGGAEGTRQLVDRFYDHMDALDEAAEIRGMHAKSLKVSRDKLFKFLSGWLGGPQLYIAEYGHPRLRARHLPFPIDDAAADQWMLCMRRALDETVDDADLTASLDKAFTRIAAHMRNR